MKISTTFSVIMSAALGAAIVAGIGISTKITEEPKARKIVSTTNFVVGSSVQLIPGNQVCIVSRILADGVEIVVASSEGGVRTQTVSRIVLRNWSTW